MCLECRPLLKAIDAYLAKADDDLADALGEEGYAEPERTLEYSRKIEDDVAEVLLEETDYFLEEAEKAVDLETFAKDVWPGVKLNDLLRSKLVTIFAEQLAEFMPEFTGHYLAQTERDLKLAQVSKRTTAWVEEWSQDLAATMQLNSHREIETILKKGLQKGDGIAEFTRHILDSGIRDEYYKARRVAVTEVLGAHSVAQQEAFMQSPSVKDKMWKHTGAYRNVPRQNHVDMNGQRVPKDAPFELSGIKGGTYFPLYPRDTILPPEERINCHCICQPVVDEDVLGMSLEERQRLQQQAIDEMDDNWERELDARNRAKAGIEAYPHYTDVTGEYERTAKPGKGKVTREAGYVEKKHEQEISTADYLHKTFGGDIELRAESKALGAKTPDYTWRGRYWELKTVTTEKSANSAVRHAVEQISGKPGGIILDYQNNEVSVEKVLETAVSRLKRSGYKEVDLIILTENREKSHIYRYKK